MWIIIIMVKKNGMVKKVSLPEHTLTIKRDSLTMKYMIFLMVIPMHIGILIDV